jgi:hypothetical protein
MYDSDADVRLCLGDQRNGKTTTCVAFIKDEYYDKMDGLISPSRQFIKARTLDDDDKHQLSSQKIYPDPFKYCRALLGNESKIISIPKGYLVSSPVRIFSNIHLYGLKYIYVPIEYFVEHVNDDLIEHGWFLAEDSAMNNPRNAMSSVGKIFAQWSQTIGKRHLHYCQATQFPNMVEVYLKQFAVMRVVCSLNKNSNMVTLDINKKGEPAQTKSYYAPNYWMNYDPDERVKIPESSQQKALDILQGVR